MSSHAMISYDLKHTEDFARTQFNDQLTAAGWIKSTVAETTWFKSFNGVMAGEAFRQLVTMEIFGAVMSTRVKEISYIAQCGNSEVIETNFMNPRFWGQVIAK